MADWNETQKHEAEYWGNCLGMRAWGEFCQAGDVRAGRWGCGKPMAMATANWSWGSGPYSMSVAARCP